MKAPKPFGGGRKRNDAANPCALCGVHVHQQKLHVEVVDGGARFVKVGEKPDEQDAGYMGCFPVGPECARRLRKAGVAVFGRQHAS